MGLIPTVSRKLGRASKISEEPSQLLYQVAFMQSCPHLLPIYPNIHSYTIQITITSILSNPNPNRGIIDPRKFKILCYRISVFRVCLAGGKLKILTKKFANKIKCLFSAVHRSRVKTSIFHGNTVL